MCGDINVLRVDVMKFSVNSSSTHDKSTPIVLHAFESCVTLSVAIVIILKIIILVRGLGYMTLIYLGVHNSNSSVLNIELKLRANSNKIK